MDALDRLIADCMLGRLRWPDSCDPQAFLARVQLHGVGALLHASIEREAPPTPVPAQVRETLRALALRAAAVDLDCRIQLPRLLELMADAGVRPILIKGTPLAYTHYPEPGQRERADTDLLVRQAERERLFALLESQGYLRGDGTGAELASAEASFWKDGSPLVLDVHWRIRSSPLLARVLEFDELEAQAVPLPALGPHARAPGPVDAVLLAAIHRASHYQSPFYVDGVAHRGDRLIWLYDLHLLAPALTEAQAAELARRAAEHRVAGLCLDALRSTGDAFGTLLPRALLEELEHAASRREPSMVFLRGGRRALLLAELGALPRWRERWQLLREHAFPPGDYILRKYETRKRWLLPALYVRRAVGWLTK
ncbi:MAG: nucleotidyltransferase family protein [Woeseiaceae bacterium]